MIWALVRPRNLPPRLREDIASPDHRVFVSPASTWEIAIKQGLGKIDAEAETIASAAETTGFEELAVRIAHTTRISTLPKVHRDPFDRLLIAQAAVEGMTLVTRDRIFERYRIPTRWE